jgi:hypothetical protein
MISGEQSDRKPARSLPLGPPCPDRVAHGSPSRNGKNYCKLCNFRSPHFVAGVKLVSKEPEILMGSAPVIRGLA